MDDTRLRADIRLTCPDCLMPMHLTTSATAEADGTIVIDCQEPALALVLHRRAHLR